MGGFEIATLLMGALCGNLGAVLIKPFNIGLFWNSVTGGVGAAVVLYLPHFLRFIRYDHWALEFLAASVGGLVLMLIIGGLTALAYRE